MAKIENELQYNWAIRRVEELMPLVNDNTLWTIRTASNLNFCLIWLLITPKNTFLWASPYCPT